MTLPVRAAIYAAVILSSAVAVGFGIMSGDLADQITLIIAGALGITGGGTAIRNLREPTTSMVVSVRDVIDALQADDGEPGRHRAATPPADPITTTIDHIRSRADQVRARYGAS